MSSQSLSQDIYRLQTDAKPTHYDLTVRTDLEQFVFDGVVTIQCAIRASLPSRFFHGSHSTLRCVSLDILKETSNIVLNSKELKLGGITLTIYDSQTQLSPTSITFDIANERCTLAFSQPLPAHSKAQLKLVFAGELTTGLAGYYLATRSTVTDGKPKYYSLTQFEVPS